MRLKKYLMLPVYVVLIMMTAAAAEIITGAVNFVTGLREQGLYYFVPLWTTVSAGLSYAAFGAPIGVYLIGVRYYGWPINNWIGMALGVVSSVALVSMILLTARLEERTAKEKVV